MCLRVWRDLTYSQLQSVVFRQMKQYLHDEVNPEVINNDTIIIIIIIIILLELQIIT